MQIFHSTPVSCEDCGGVFGSEEELDAHIKESHDVGGGREEEEAEKNVEKAVETSTVAVESSPMASPSSASKTPSKSYEAMEEEEFDEEDMAEFERMVQGGGEGDGGKSGGERNGDREGEKTSNKNHASLASASSAKNCASSSADGVFIKREIVDDDDDVMIEEVVREPRRSVTPPIKMEPVTFADEELTPPVALPVIGSGATAASGDFRSMETDSATLHLRRINRPLSKADVKAYFFPYMPVRVKIRRSTLSVDAWETFFQFRSQKSKERAMRHGHLLHQELPLENLGFDVDMETNSADEADIDPKLYFEDPNGKVVELEGVVSRPHMGPQTAASKTLPSLSKLPAPPLTAMGKKLGRPRSGASTDAMAAIAAVAGAGAAPSAGGAKQNLPKIKLNLQQLQQLLGDKQSGLQKNAQGQLILKMPNKDIGQISEKLRKLSQPQKAPSPKEGPQQKSGESLSNVNIIYPSTGGGAKTGVSTVSALSSCQPE